MRRHASTCLVLLAVSLRSACAADEIGKGFYFLDITPGQKVTIPGTFTDKGTRRASLTAVSNPDATPEQVEAAASENSVSFVLRNDLPADRYRVSIQLVGGASTPVPGELRVGKVSEQPVTIEAVQARSLYRNPQHNNRYDFEIAGTNFAPALENDTIEINKLPLDLERDPACSGTYEKPCLRAEPGNQTRKLVVEGFDPTGSQRPLQVRVRVGIGNNVSKEMPLALARVSERALRLLSVTAFALVMLAVFALVRKGIRTEKIDGASYGPLYAFLMDKETDSYSLSKFQLLLFTLVAVFGYIYVFLCRMLVQWNFDLPPVPDGLPGMLAVSAGTTVAAAGITVTRGNKGAGAVTPSMADFISSGGLVLPERFQFFVWTLISSFGLVAALLAADPMTVTTLPKLPDGMLYLMGLSSAGYLGGKLVRRPGPNITSIDAAKVEVDPATHATALEVKLVGNNLSRQATFQLDEKEVPADQIARFDPTPQAQDADFCTSMKVQLKVVAAIYYEGQHTLRIINGDAQAADVKYGALIESIKDIPQGAAATAVSVIGANFKDPSSAEWTNAAGVTTRIDASNVTKKSETELSVTLTPGGVGTGKLTIKSPGGLTTSANVKIV